jgi:hypothetical protein
MQVLLKKCNPSRSNSSLTNILINGPINHSDNPSGTVDYTLIVRGENKGYVLLSVHAFHDIQQVHG